MIKGLPFSLNAVSIPIYTLTASQIGLTTFTDCVVSNNGPGACGIWPSGTASGPPAEIIGAQQRRYVILGSVDTICASTLPSTNPNFFNNFSNKLSASLVVSDNYSLVGTTDYRAGRSFLISQQSDLLPFPAGTISATDIGFDKIRGIYIPPQPLPPSFYYLDPNDTVPSLYPVITESGMSIALDLDFVSYKGMTATVPIPAAFLSDEPIIAGAAGGGTYG